MAPAYGTWRQTAPGRFEARYLFFITRPPARLEEIVAGNGWPPSGYGIFAEQLTLSADGRSFTSNIVYEAFDSSGKPATGGGAGTGRGTRIGF